MIFHADELSLFETCPRLPQISRIYEPPRYPIREGIKQYLEQGIRALMFGGGNPEDMRNLFIGTASSPGFIYPKNAEPFILASDHADWLEGALELIKAEFEPMQLMPVYKIGNYQLHIEGWLDKDENVHLFRAKANLLERKLYWPEIAALALTGKEVSIHVYRLPSVREGRLVSPLNMAYKHPTFNVNLRLARLYDEPEFNKNWKKVARWEVSPAIKWEEWALGIERDKCLDQIRETFTISPILDAQGRDKIRFDIEHMCAVMEKPHIWARFREACQSCYFSKLCHGDEASRDEYKIVDPEALEKYQKSLEKLLT
jgi:hypothetical protein